MIYIILIDNMTQISLQLTFSVRIVADFVALSCQVTEKLKRTATTVLTHGIIARAREWIIPGKRKMYMSLAGKYFVNKNVLVKRSLLNVDHMR